MTKNKELLFIYFFIVLELIILIKSDIITNNIVTTSKLFINSIFPSLFPTVFIGLVLINLNFYKIIPKSINLFFNKLFNFNEIHTALFFISFICGAPSHALYINNYLQKDLITKKEAEILLRTCNFINPLFILNVVGIKIFNDVKIGIVIILIKILSTFIKLFIFKKHFTTKKSNIISNDNKNIFNIIIKCLNQTLSTLLNIFSIIILFNILISLITNIFSLNYFQSTIISMFLELTSGITKLKYLNLNIFSKIFIAYIFISFNGLCIKFQSINLIQKKE